MPKNNLYCDAIRNFKKHGTVPTMTSELYWESVRFNGIYHNDYTFTDDVTIKWHNRLIIHNEDTFDETEEPDLFFVPTDSMYPLWLEIIKNNTHHDLNMKIIKLVPFNELIKLRTHAHLKRDKNGKSCGYLYVMIASRYVDIDELIDYMETVPFVFNEGAISYSSVDPKFMRYLTKKLTIMSQNIFNGLTYNKNAEFTIFDYLRFMNISPDIDYYPNQHYPVQWEAVCYFKESKSIKEHFYWLNTIKDILNGSIPSNINEIYWKSIRSDIKKFYENKQIVDIITNTEIKIYNKFAINNCGSINDNDLNNVDLYFIGKKYPLWLEIIMNNTHNDVKMKIIERIPVQNMIVKNIFGKNSPLYICILSNYIDNDYLFDLARHIDINPHSCFPDVKMSIRCFLFYNVKMNYYIIGYIYKHYPFYELIKLLNMEVITIQDIEELFSKDGYRKFITLMISTMIKMYYHDQPKRQMKRICREITGLPGIGITYQNSLENYNKCF